MIPALVIVLCLAAVAVAFGGWALFLGPRRKARRPPQWEAGPVDEIPVPPPRDPRDVTTATKAPVRPAGQGRRPGGRPTPTLPPERPPARDELVDGQALPAGELAPADGTTGDIDVVEVEPQAAVAPELLARPRFRDRLGKARSSLAGHLAGLRGRGKLDEEAWEELEEALILADVGVVTVQQILDDLRTRARQEKFERPAQLVAALRDELVAKLQGDLDLHRAGEGATTVWLFVGVNGVGKTTTIGKIGMREVSEGRRVVMAAGDTFRAAAADQLQLWSERSGAGFVRGNEGGDPGAVVFDAVQHAAARGADLVLADTAGRLHNKVNLMEELKKVRRVADRAPGSVSEVLLVIDATTGQNGLVQARQFSEAVEVTGVVLTKLDGTAKGGIAVAIAGELGIPIKLVGLGEGPEDLVPFDAEEFVDALLPAEGA
ncbi:MAG TPA: signal recognition particle-docking protein FtsY [Acidimicrobiales bacterium]|nr:signal recognition particle-docking protein FtsY [Acidimicrobiales bacterium]